MTLRSKASRALASFYSSLLFVPTLLTLATLGLFLVTSAVDASIESDVAGWLATGRGELWGFLVFGGSPTAASSLLSTIAGTWATIVGVVYSVTLVTLQLSATKYSAQVIPMFERDRFNQTVLGTFTGTFVYALLVLKTVRVEAGERGAEFTPIVGVNVAIVLAVLSLFLFVGFIANLATYIRPTRFVDDLAAASARSARRLRRDLARAGFAMDEDAPSPSEGPSVEVEVRASERGNLGHIHWARLARALARAPAPGSPTPRARASIELVLPLGGAVEEGDVLAVARAPDAAAVEALREAAAGAFTIRTVRTNEHDPFFAIETIADIAITALSGGGTDVGVAEGCVRAELRILKQGLALAPFGRRYATRAGGGIVVEAALPPLHAASLRALSRILDKARAEDRWDVWETFTREATRALVQAADRDPAAWRETLEWLATLASRIDEFGNAASRARMRENLARATGEVGARNPQAGVEMRARLGRGT